MKSKFNEGKKAERKGQGGQHNTYPFGLLKTGLTSLQNANIKMKIVK